MTYILDTNILVHTLRNSITYRYIKKKYNPYNYNNNAIVSAVTVGELYSIAKQNQWGYSKMERVREIIKTVKVIPVESEFLLETYADIDTFSQGKLPNIPLGTSSRNMGKNDLWIAATTFIFDGTLLTTDNDFNHLHNVFFNVEKIS